jgi:hypothetical protein
LREWPWLKACGRWSSFIVAALRPLLSRKQSGWVARRGSEEVIKRRNPCRGQEDQEEDQREWPTKGRALEVDVGGVVCCSSMVVGLLF